MRWQHAWRLSTSLPRRDDDSPITALHPGLHREETGDIANTPDAKVLGRFMLNVWQGALVRTKVEKSDEPFKDFSAVVFEIILK